MLEGTATGTDTRVGIGRVREAERELEGGVEFVSGVDKGLKEQIEDVELVKEGRPGSMDAEGGNGSIEEVGFVIGEMEW